MQFASIQLWENSCVQSGVCIVFLLLLGSFNAGIVETLDNQQRS